jgi:spore coat protein U-like protein
MKRCLVPLLLALGLCVPATSHAAQRCRLEVQGVSFGDYMPGAQAPVDSAAFLSVRCVGNPPGPFVVKIGPGLSGDPGQRTMQSGAETLFYNLFVDGARTRIWGDGTGGTESVVVEPGPARDGRPRQTELSVYGRIPAGQDPTPGAYSDTIIVTVEF